MIKLILTKPEKVNKVFLENLHKVKGGTLGVLSSKPFYSSKKEFETGCKNKTCLFIDTVSESKGENVIYIDASNLTGLSIAINQGIQGLGKNPSIVFDSLSNLSIRNNPEVLIKFISFILKKSLDWKSNLILILPDESSNEKLISVIKQAADKVEKK